MLTSILPLLTAIVGVGSTALPGSGRDVVTIDGAGAGRVAVAHDAGISIVDPFPGGDPQLRGSVLEPALVDVDDRRLARIGSILFSTSPDGGGLAVINAANPDLPALLLQDDAIVTRGDALAVDSSGNRLFVHAGSDLVAIDVSTPAAPVQLGRLTLGGTSGRGLDYANQLVYAAVEGALVVVDVSGLPAMPIVSWLTGPETLAHDVRLLDAETAIVTDNRVEGLVTTFDIARPAECASAPSAGPCGGRSA